MDKNNLPEQLKGKLFSLETASGDFVNVDALRLAIALLNHYDGKPHSPLTQTLFFYRATWASLTPECASRYTTLESLTDRVHPNRISAMLNEFDKLVGESETHNPWVNWEVARKKGIEHFRGGWRG